MALYLRVLGGDLGAAQVWFEQRVLDRYRGRRAEGWRVMRTNSVGRLQAPERWSLDFGIAGEQEAYIHASAAELAQRLPARERQHWAQHLVTLPVSGVFVSMRLSGGHSCIDDGELRSWE